MFAVRADAASRLNGGQTINELNKWHGPVPIHILPPEEFPTITAADRLTPASDIQRVEDNVASPANGANTLTLGGRGISGGRHVIAGDHTRRGFDTAEPGHINRSGATVRPLNSARGFTRRRWHAPLGARRAANDVLGASRRAGSRLNLKTAGNEPTRRRCQRPPLTINNNSLNSKSAFRHSRSL